jgi:hypothetical protein
LGARTALAGFSCPPDHFKVEFSPQKMQECGKSMLNSQPEKTVAEFFAGIGLMRIGLERAGWRVLFANDIDGDKQQMYEHHFGPAEEFALQDVHKLQPSEVPTVALATASFPCNDLSLAGARKGLAGTHSSAFWGFPNVVEPGPLRLSVKPNESETSRRSGSDD